MSYQDFKNEVLGNGYDIDGYYGNQCLTGEYLVKMSDGDYKYVKDLVAGDKLSTGNIVVSNEPKQSKVYYLNTSQGWFKVTEDHKVFLKDGSYKKVTELTKKDSIVIDLKESVKVYNLTEDELKFFGFWLGEGSVHKRKENSKTATVLITVSTEDKLNYLKGLDIHHTSHKHSNGKADIINLQVRYHPELLKVIQDFSDKNLTDVFTKEQYLHIIEGYLKADGCSKKGSNSNIATSINKQLLVTLQHGCHLNDISARLSKKIERKATNFTNNPKPYWRLSVNKEKNLLNNFISLEELDEEETIYVLNTDGDHSYYADNQLHHNCWDGYAKYCQSLGVPYANCNVTGYVRDLWEQRTSNGILNYFDEVSVMQAGDVAIFKVVAGVTPYSHVAIFDSDAGNGYGNFLGQNQGATNGVFNIVTLPYSATYDTAFRPKTSVTASTTTASQSSTTNLGGSNITLLKTNSVLKKGDIVLDVASYQADNLASTLASAGTQYTFVKATEGTSYTNPKMASQTNSSTVKGYYHFAHFGGDSSTAQQEANHFLSVIGNGDGTKFAILDYEKGASSDKNANTQAILTFMRAVKNAGWIPLFYSYTSYMSYFAIDTILSEFPKSFWEAWYLTTDASYEPTWDYQRKLSGKASIWQWTDNYKGLNVDGSVVLEDLGTTSTSVTLDEVLNMDFVMRSKSGIQGYVGVVDGAPFGIGDIGTVVALQDAGAQHIIAGSDDDFNRIYDSIRLRHDALLNGANALQAIANK